MPTTKTKYKVRVEIHGQARSRIGVLLIKLGARLAFVHAKIWIQEISPRIPESQK